MARARPRLLCQLWCGRPNMAPGASAIMQYAPGLRARKELKQWVKGWRNWPPRRRPAARLHQMRSRKLSYFWPRIVPVLFTAQNSRSMGVAALFEIAVVKNSLGRNLERKINFHAISKEGASIMA